MEKIKLEMKAAICPAGESSPDGAGEPPAGGGSLPAGGAQADASPQTAGGRRYRARFVRCGRARTSANQPADIEILAQALSRAVGRGLFDHKAVFVDHAYASLPGTNLWQNASVERLVGVTNAASFDGCSVEGEIELYDTPLACAVASLLDELLRQGDQAPDIGLSIVFYPVWERPASGWDRAQHNSASRKVVDISYVESVDLVFQPAADGRILAALGAEYLQTQGDFDMQEPTTPHPASRGEPPVRYFSAAQALRLQSELDDPSGLAIEPQAALDGGQPASSAQDWLAALSNLGAQAAINASSLPQPARQRLLAQFCPGDSNGSPRISSAPAYTPADVEGAIEAERLYLAALQENQVVQLGGAPPRGPRLSGMQDGLDRLSLALEALIAGVRPAAGVQPLTGIREAYHLLSGDYEMSGVFQPERVMFANVTSSTMAALVANALNKRLANEFMQYPQWWSPVVSIEDFTTLQDVRWITLGGVGELPTVAEGAAYTELSWDDKTETASFVKKGGYLGITLEAIDKDDTGRLRAAPRALAQAAWLTLSKAISNIFTQSSGVGPTMSDSLALFHASHSNLGSTALSRSSYLTARLAMRKQTELNSGERLGALTAPKFLLVPPDLEITALEVLASEYDHTYALSNAPAAPANVLAEGDSFNQRLAFARSRVIVVDLWTDTNDWAACADPRMYPTIGLGFRYGRMPEIFSVASPTAGLMFSNDTMPIKARFFFAVGPIDYKGLYKANVA